MQKEVETRGLLGSSLFLVLSSVAGLCVNMSYSSRHSISSDHVVPFDFLVMASVKYEVQEKLLFEMAAAHQLVEHHAASSFSVCCL